MLFPRIVLAGLLFSLAAVAQDKSQEELLSGDVGFDILDAIDRGLERAGGGKVFHAELEPDRGGLAYSIDIDLGEKSVNVVMDANSGEIYEHVPESADLTKVLASSKIELKKAVRIAQGMEKGRIVDAQLVSLRGRPLFAVKLLREKQISRIFIDAVTGKQLDLDRAKKKPQDSPKTESDMYSRSFTVKRSELGPTGRNPYFILEPGYFLILEGKEGKDRVRLKITILDETKVVDGVTTRVLEERETVNGQLIEISRNFVAISNRTTDVYYFGEEVAIYKDGKVVGHEGEWISGENGAVFGLFMPANPLLGARYYQEIAPGAAMDRAEIESVTETVETPAGTFKNCLRVRETTPLEPGVKEFKYHKKGIGLIQDADLKLLKWGKK